MKIQKIYIIENTSVARNDKLCQSYVGFIERDSVKKVKC